MVESGHRFLLRTAMKFRAMIARFYLASAFVLTCCVTTLAAEPPVEFNREIRPILAKKCFACHGPDEDHREGGLRLDTQEGATAKLESGKSAIVAGKESQSELLLRITSSDESERMPPAETGITLTPAQIDLLKRWIDQSASYVPHWSFVKPERPALPTAKHADWAEGGLDRFILARLEAEGLAPAPRADRYALIRRASLDLRGIPPTPQEAANFVADRAPDAYERLVDRFLADPAYGERWARMWLDQARYADSRGYGSDPLRPNIWRYRDWVIDALNADLPYDRFTIEQLAGDLLPDATLDQKIATAFHRNTMTNTEGGTDDEEFRVAAVKDRVDTTMQVWMGITIGCAKCHNHKYDPVSNREYYQLYALFNQTVDSDKPDESPTLSTPSPEYESKLRLFEDQVADIKAKIAAAEQSPKEGSAENPDAKALRDKLKALERTKPALPSVPVMQELPADKRRTTFVQIKGNFLNKGEEASPGLPAAWHHLPEGVPRDRMGVAQWLVHRDNPLTARVAVNRLWAQLFGAGIVLTEEDFGIQGELPSHPELLDWLAVEFADSAAWDMKRLLRQIVTSSTYCQTAHVSPEALAKDPRNRLMSRGPRFRLEAEMVRDQALSLAGLLSRKLRGPSVYPPQPPGLWQAAFNGERTWPTSTGEDAHRRGLYTFWRRTIPYPSMTTFDAPSRETCSLRRFRTNTPLQAFVTLNDPVYVEAAQALARRLTEESGSTASERAAFGLQLCLIRPPSSAQVESLVQLYESELAHFRADSAAAVKMAGNLPLGTVSADPAEIAAWTVVANVLLNLDGVLMKG
jgi:mono/diheme cytochrome c family protein